MKSQLTVSQAKAQGYTLFGEPSHEWHHLTPIDDFYPKEGKKVFLAEKEPEIFKFGNEEIRELLSDTIGENESEATGRDTDCIYDAIIKIDFSHAANLIKQVLEKHPTYKLTDIELIEG